MSEEKDVETVIRELNALAREVEGFKQERERKVGRRDELLANLKRSFGVNTVKEAILKIKSLEVQVTNRNKQISESFIKVKARFATEGPDASR